MNKKLHSKKLIDARFKKLVYKRKYGKRKEYFYRINLPFK